MEVRNYREDFRSSISTVDNTGNRNWVYPKKPSDRYYKWRTYVSWLLLAVLFSLPFIKINGQPFILLNFIERKFIIFGQIFWPSDFYIFFITLLTFIIFVILFTVIFGRLWCGWACPQTIFMEMVFRKIEYFIEGDYIKQKKLAKQPWNREKIIKKGSKHFIFIAIAFAIGNLLMAYLVGVDELKKIVTSPPAENLAGFIAVVAFSGIFYWVFAYFREQACTIVCPYGRLQSVLLDKHSLVVSYDYNRGEQRAKNTRNRPEDAGDCIDCNQCVDVCPTGIDIRNGLQLECVSCAACIDACDFVMTKVNKPTGLIRHTSEENIESGIKFRVTPRIIGYSSFLVVLMGLLTFLLISTKDINTNLTREAGSMYVTTEEGKIRNIYRLKIGNKTYEPLELDLRIEGQYGEVMVNGKDLVVPAEDYTERMVFIDIPREEIASGKFDVQVGVYKNGQKLDKVTTTFFGPIN